MMKMKKGYMVFTSLCVAVLAGSSMVGCGTVDTKTEKATLEVTTVEETTVEETTVEETTKNTVNDETVKEKQGLSEEEQKKIEKVVFKGKDLSPLLFGIVEAKYSPLAKEMNEEELICMETAYSLNTIMSYDSTEKPPFSKEEVTLVENKYSVAQDVMEQIGSVVAGEKLTEKNLPKNNYINFNEKEKRYEVSVGEIGAVKFSVKSKEFTEDGLLIEGDSCSYDNTVRYEYSIRLKYNPDNIYNISIEEIQITE